METTPSLKPIILQYGILLGIISVVFGLMIYFLDMHYTQEPSVGVVSILIFITVITIGQYNFKKENQGYLSLSEALKLGMGIALISGIISISYQLLLVNVIDPNTTDKMMEIARNKLIDDQPELSQEQVDQFVDMQRSFTTPGMTIAFGLIFSLFFGFIISLISGLILKRNRPE